MALTLDELATSISYVDVLWQGQSVKIGFNPNVLTPKMTRELRVRAANSDDEEAATTEVVAILVKMLADWDIYATREDEARGHAVPITAEALENLPGMLLAAILKAVVEGATQDPNSPRGGSAAGSDAPISMKNRKR